jgi:hypothetical protein
LLIKGALIVEGFEGLDSPVVLLELFLVYVLEKVLESLMTAIKLFDMHLKLLRFESFSKLLIGVIFFAVMRLKFVTYF